MERQDLPTLLRARAQDATEDPFLLRKAAVEPWASIQAHLADVPGFCQQALEEGQLIRSVGHGAPGRRPSLADFVRDKLRERMVPGDIDRDALVDLGLRYLKDAEERDSPSATVPPATEA